MNALKLAVASFSLIWSSVAQAELFDFSLDGPYAASWQIDTADAPFSSDIEGFTYAQVAGAFPGAGMLGVDIDFKVGSGDEILRLTDFEEGTILATLGGARLFEGETSAPRFLTGSFSLSNMGGGASTLTIRNLSTAAVPEPATWAMMIAGFGVVGAAMRRRGTLVQKAA